MSLASEILKKSPFLSSVLSSPEDSETSARLGDFPVDELLFGDANKAVLSGKDYRSGRPARFVVFPARPFDLMKTVENLRIDHPHVDVFERVEDVSGHPMLVLAAIKAMPLDKVESLRQIPVRHVIRIARETLEALAAGRQRGLTHGFLSSLWVWLEGSQAIVRVVGLGWRSLEPPGAGDLASFLTGASIDCLSPEAAEGKPSDHRSDLFAVGTLLYRMLTKADPYPGDSPLSIIRSLAMHDPVPPSKRGAESSPELDAFVLRLLARNPADRPADAADAARMLAEIEKLPLAPPQSAKSSPPAPRNERPAPPIVPTLAPDRPMESDLRMLSPETVGGFPADEGSTLDAMTIELLPIDEEPPARNHSATRDRSKPKPEKPSRTAGVGGGSGHEDFPTPIDWVYLADTTVEAIHLCGESQTLFIRESSGRVVVLSAEGDVRAAELSPEPIKLSAAAQSGQLLAMVVGKTNLVLLDGDLNVLVERRLHSEPLALAVDSLGLYVAVSFQGSETRLYTRAGKPAGSFESRQPLALMAFVPGTARLLGATKFDQFLGIDLYPDKGRELVPAVAWARNTGMPFAHLHVIGGSRKALASCNVMGLQRLDADGENEGSYQLGGTVIEAASDYPGRFFLASTLEGSLLAVNVNGAVLWQYDRGGPWRHLCVDPLGRYALAASDSGQVLRVSLSTEPRTDQASRVRTITAAGEAADASIREADWSLRIAGENDTSQGYDLCVVDTPKRVCVLDPKKTLVCYDAEGAVSESVPSLGGVGRMMIAREGWLAVANDRTLVLQDFAGGQTYRPDLDLVQITHFDMRPRSYGMAIVQEGDRLGRATAAGRWIWRVALPATAESMVLSDDGHVAMSLDNGLLNVLDPGGREIGRWSAGEQEALLACESPSGGGDRFRWISLSRQEQVLRGHALDSSLIWQKEVPIRGWTLTKTGQGAVVSDDRGTALLYDARGQVVAQRRADSGRTLFGTAADGSTVALRWERGQLYLTRFDGSPIWRGVVEAEIDAAALGPSGVAILAAGVLSWFAEAR
jgi:YD repeat-containing protein